MTTPNLDVLLALQDLDSSIGQHRHRRSHLPEMAELAAIDQALAVLTNAAVEATAARDEIAAREAAVEADLAATEARAATVSRRLYGGEVSASRELQAMATDVDALTVRASALEDEALEIMELREPFEAQISELAAQAVALEERRVATAAALSASQAQVDDELARLTAERADAAATVPEDLLARYDALRARLDGVAVARLVGNHCDGCHLTLPSMELDRLRHLEDREVATCDQCGRILVRSGSH